MAAIQALTEAKDRSDTATIPSLEIAAVLVYIKVSYKINFDVTPTSGLCKLLLPKLDVNCIKCSDLEGLKEMFPSMHQYVFKYDMKCYQFCKPTYFRGCFIWCLAIFHVTSWQFIFAVN